jgi:hypothetical protein
LRAALAEVYAYYRRTERLLFNVLRDTEGDAEINAIVREVHKPMIAHWERMKNTLATAWEVSEERLPRLLRGAIGVALDFQTWRTTVRGQGLTDERAIDLMAGMVRCTR